jgi:hypothetical protein
VGPVSGLPFRRAPLKSRNNYNPGFVCSSPAIGYNIDENHDRWVFITTRSDGGKLYGFRTER